MRDTAGTSFPLKKSRKLILVSIIFLLLILGIFSSYALFSLRSARTSHHLKTDSCLVIGYSPAQMKSRNASLGKSPAYDEQWLMGIANNVTFISYNVTLTKQNDSFGSWPIYLVNALTNNNFWYQLGIDGGWVGKTGPNASFQVWTPSGIFAHGQFPLSNASAIRNADIVLLSINLTEEQVVMNIHDWNTTSSSGSMMLPVMGSTVFVGSRTPQQFFTGPMTEWYHFSPSFCDNNGDLVTFSTDLAQETQTPGWLGIDQWNFTQLPAAVNVTNVGPQYQMFNGFEVLPPQSSNLTTFNVDGNAESVNASEFITP